MDAILKIRCKAEPDRFWVELLSRDAWGSEVVIVHGEMYQPAELDGMIAEVGGEKAGLATYRIKGGACEIVTLNAMRPGLGIGNLLIRQVTGLAEHKGCEKIWLITTNDNTRALRFYQKNGFHLSGLRVGVMENYRKIKPEIPLTGEDGIPIRDEIELEMEL